MDKYNVIDIPNDLDSLEQDFNNWSLLPYDLRKISDDACNERYGCNNTQLYNILKARLLQYSNEDIVSESASMNEFLINVKQIFKEGFRNPENSHIDAIPGYSSNGQVSDILDKIERSKQVHEMDDDWIVIYDFLNDKYPDYDMNELDKMYDIYVMASTDHKKISDNYSMEIWGNTVPNMYSYMKNKLETLDTIDNDEEFVHVDKNEDELNGYQQTIKSEAADIVQSLVRKIDCYNSNPNRSVHEAEVLEGYGDNIKVGKKTYRQDMPGVVPFLTYHEYLHNTKSQDQKKINNIDPFSYVFNYKETAETLMDKYCKGDKQGLLEVGWNPEVKPTTEAISFARDKQIKWFNENKSFEYLDISKFDVLEESEDMAKNSKLSPIFLIIASNDPVEEVKKRLKRNVMFKTLRDYSHIGVATEADLKTIYTFESVAKDRANRLKVESIDNYKSDQYIHVIAFFVFNDVKKAIKVSLNNYLSNKDNSIYGFDNVMSILTDKPKSASVNPYVIIGSFIDSIMKIANLYDKTGKSEIGRGLFANTEEGKVSTGGKLYVLYSGQADKYKDKKVKKTIDWLKKNAEFNKMNFFGAVTTTSEYIDPSDHGFYTFDTYLKQYSSPKLMEAVMNLREAVNIELGKVEYLKYDDIYSEEFIYNILAYNKILEDKIKTEKEPGKLKDILNELYKVNLYVTSLRRLNSDDMEFFRLIEHRIAINDTLIKYNFCKVKEFYPEFHFPENVSHVDPKLFKYNLWKPEI